MMKKTGAGWFVFVAGAFLFFGGTLGVGGAAFAQEAIDAPAAESAVAGPVDAPAAAPAEESTPPAPFLEANRKAAARLESVQDKTLDELKELLAQSEASLPTMGKASSEKNNELREARIAANREAPEIRALYKQIEELQGKIAAVTDTLPGVKEKLDAYTASQSALFEEMQFRTKLMGLIRQRENADSPTAAREVAP